MCEIITRRLCALYPLELPKIVSVPHALESETGLLAMATQPPPSPDLQNENTDAEHIEEIKVNLPYNF